MTAPVKAKGSRSAARHSAFQDSDEDDDHARSTVRSSSREEEITSFGRHGAQKRTSSPPRTSAPRIIPVASNLDWRQDRKQRMGIATHLQSLGPLVSMRRADSSAVPDSSAAAQTGSADAADAINIEAQKRGLELRQPKIKPSSTDQQADSTPRSDNAPAAETEEPAEQGTDQEALKALLAGDDAGSQFNSGAPLVIRQEDEAEFLQHDIDSRPEAPSLDDYAATPIEQFGIALLRGMGWKEGMGAGKGGKGPQQAPEPKKRAALLGLGAKERSVPATALPSSASSSSRTPKSTARRDYRYVPVAKVDRQPTRNGHASSTEARSPQGSRSSDRTVSQQASSDRDARRDDRSQRYADSRDGRRESHSRSSRRRSKSPSGARDDRAGRHRDHKRDGRHKDHRSHGASSSEHRRDRDHDDSRRDDRHRDERHRDRRR